uniref:non-specific serine/threonine protein kinase n=1 Tax=Parascaris univalens TaxID=6257 RepID=A0A915BL55_PARUN
MSRALSRTPAAGGGSDNYNPSYAVLDGLYALHDELGSGGFGKVKLATHLLTSQSVAIKIIDKKTIGDDLPRVKTELEALKTLSHQNICRLYQSIETDEKFFIVMEYCSGGEMFDYIVKKERLEESEARHFFRQLVQAIAYAHHMGFAHRDLKPVGENLLLTEDLQLKLIDFGLCARPDTGLNRPLDTCCGSPAYAAPELIQGSAYLGNEADVWSMGVLLYALLCGSLPFEDDNMQALYRKISRGVYHEPEYLSASSRDLLRSLLQVNPKNRITIRELIVHPWLNKKYSQPLRWKSVYDRKIVDEEVARELAAHFGKSLTDMECLIKEWRFDYLTATYYLLLLQKRRGMKFALPVPKPADHAHDSTGALLSSPTIHASLDFDLNKSGLEEDDDGYVTAVEAASHTAEGACEISKKPHSNDSFIKPLLPLPHCDKNFSYACAMLNMPSVCTGRSPQQRGACNLWYPNVPSANATNLPPSFVTPLRQKTRPQTGIGFDTKFYCRANESDKENFRPATVKVRGPVKLYDDGRPRSGLHTTPIKMTLHGLCGSPKPRSHSVERGTPPTPSSTTGDRAPRSSTKTPRLRQRVFASLERQADKMINLLTPRKVKSSTPEVLKQTKTMVNVSMTSSRNPELVRRELVRVFAEQNICVEQHGWKISGKRRDEFNRLMTVELEVVLIEMGDRERLVGVKRKRLNGDAFLYKKVCEQVLQLAGL